MMEGQFSRMAPALLLYCSLLSSLLLVLLPTPSNAQHLSAAKRCLDIEPITHRLIVTSVDPGDERSASPLTFFVEEESRIHQITVASSGNLLSPAQLFPERGRANSSCAEQCPSINFQFCRLTVKGLPSAASLSTTLQPLPLPLLPLITAATRSDFPLTSLRGCFWRSTPATRFDRRPDSDTMIASSTRTLVRRPSASSRLKGVAHTRLALAGWA
jgi:hypothetical protein